jgi:hypothetical protein
MLVLAVSAIAGLTSTKTASPASSEINLPSASIPIHSSDGVGAISLRFSFTNYDSCQCGQHMREAIDICGLPALRHEPRKIS